MGGTLSEIIATAPQNRRTSGLNPAGEDRTPKHMAKIQFLSFTIMACLFTICEPAHAQSEHLFLPAAEGQAPIGYTIYPPKDSEAQGAPMVLHLYGAGGSSTVHNMMREPYNDLRAQLHAAGYWLVVPDLGPAHWMNEQAVASVDAMLDFMVDKHHVDPKRIHLLGTSMGAGSGLRYLYLRPNRIRSMVALFPMTDFDAWTQETPRFRSPVCKANGLEITDREGLRKLSPLFHVAEYKNTPLFLLHGMADKIVPIHHSRDFAAAVKKQGGSVLSREVPGLGHKDAVAGDYQNAIFTFFDQGLEAARASLESPAKPIKPGSGA